MKKNDGFSLSEVTVAMGIILILMASILPIYQLIEKEQFRLKQRHIVTAGLHDSLLEVIWGNQPLADQIIMVNNRQISIHFKTEGGYIKGCANWDGVRNKEEKVCLYGIKE